MSKSSTMLSALPPLSLHLPSRSSFGSKKEEAQRPRSLEEVGLQTGHAAPCLSVLDSGYLLATQSLGKKARARHCCLHLSGLKPKGICHGFVQSSDNRSVCPVQ